MVIGLDPIGALRDGISAVAKLEQRAADAISGLIPDDLYFSPKLAPYTPLPAAQRAAAAKRSEGLEYPQRRIRDDEGGQNEPVNLVMTGTKAEVIDALEKGGWTQAVELNAISGLKSAATFFNKLTKINKIVNFNYDATPVSDMYLYGKRSSMAFNKNMNHDMARDHLRVFETDRLDASGRPIWEVAATRDTGLHINLAERRGGHIIDHAVDTERDMVMADLLAAGEVGDWRIAKGAMTDAERAAMAKDFQTDGNLYTVNLAPHPELDEERMLHGNSLARRVYRHLPDPIQDGLHSLDKKLTGWFRSMG